MLVTICSLPRLLVGFTLTRKGTLSLVLLLIWCSGFAQVKGRVTDKATGAPVAYANIQVESGLTGTTAAENGTFLLDAAASGNSFLIVSSVGYEQKRVRAGADVLQIELEPQAFTLSEVTVRKPGKARKRTIEAFKKSDLKSGFGIGSQNPNPWIIARYIPFKPEYTQTPYIEELTLVTRSEVDNVKFRLRLLRAKADGSPGEDLLLTQIIAQAPKGNKAVTVNISQYNAQVPPNGFFVAFEWLLIPENGHKHSYTRKDGTKRTITSYEPTLAAALVKTNSHTWIYTGGTWSRNHVRHSDNTYSEPQYKVVLSQ